MPITFEEVTAAIEPERGPSNRGEASAAPQPAAPAGLGADELAARLDEHLRLLAERRARLADD